MAKRERILTEDEKKVEKFQAAIHAIVGSDEFQVYTHDHDFELLSRSAVAYILNTGRMTITKNVTMLAYAFLVGFMFGKKITEFEEKPNDPATPPTA